MKLKRLIINLFLALILYKNNIQQEGGQAYDEQTIALILYKNNIQLIEKDMNRNK